MNLNEIINIQDLTQSLQSVFNINNVSTSQITWLGNLILNEFGYRCPYLTKDQFLARLNGVTSKYVILIINFFIKNEALINAFYLLQNKYTSMSNQNQDLTSLSTTTADNSNYATDGTSFDPVNEGTLQATLSQASQSINAQNIANATLSNSNSQSNSQNNITNKQQNQNTSLNLNDLTNLSTQASNILKPYLYEVASLFYVIQPNTWTGGWF